MSPSSTLHLAPGPVFNPQPLSSSAGAFSEEPNTQAWRKLVDMSPSKSPDGGSGPVPSNQQDSHISKEEKEPATLTSLPNELILEICKGLKKRGRISLCNTSRQLHACIAPLIYSSIVISTKSQYYRRNNLLQANPRLALYVKKLVIRDEDEEYRGRSEHIHLQEGLVSTLSDLTHLSLQYGWTHWQGLLGLPLNLPHLRSLIFCAFNPPYPLTACWR